MKEYIDNDFKAWTVSYSIDERSEAEFTIPGELSLVFILGDAINEALTSGRFNLIYSPGSDVNFKLGTGRYVFFGLNIMPSYLENLDLPLLSEFVEQVRTGTPVSLNKHGFYIVNEAKSLIGEIIMEINRGVACQKMHMRTLLHGLVEKSLGQADKINDEEDIQFDKVRDHINNNLATVTVVSIEDKLQMSPMYLRMLIKKKANMRPVTFIITCRMEKGMLLLQQGFRLLEIARRVGYSGQSAFSKAFLKKYGKWPTEVRGKLPQPTEEHQCLY
ncbi:MAG TPA: helix-turn-helix transcriptional regulator [Cyclobacteriaceae bacterium]|nr:helix-turn-helix transcriptional regulator [Cyclobacteriaceae bacterium]